MFIHVHSFIHINGQIFELDTRFLRWLEVQPAEIWGEDLYNSLSADLPAAALEG